MMNVNLPLNRDKIDLESIYKMYLINCMSFLI